MFVRLITPPDVWDNIEFYSWGNSKKKKKLNKLSLECKNSFTVLNYIYDRQRWSFIERSMEAVQEVGINCCLRSFSLRTLDIHLYRDGYGRHLSNASLFKIYRWSINFRCPSADDEWNVVIFSFPTRSSSRWDILLLLLLPGTIKHPHLSWAPVNL